MSQAPKCQAFTQNGKGPRCSRNALPGKIYCTQHLKIYESEKKLEEKKIEFKNQSPIESTILIPDLNNIVNEYAYGTFDPIESLKYSQLYPKKYSYSEYLEDLKNYEYENFQELNSKITSENMVLERLKNEYQLNGSIVNFNKIYDFGYNLIDYVIQEFKAKNLEVPIINIIKNNRYLNNSVLKVTLEKSDPLYNKKNNTVYFATDGLANDINISNKKYMNKIFYNELSYFWMLIFVIMYDVKS
jgi:hypothetical protein